MDRVPERMSHWWRGLDDQQRRHGAVLALIGALYIGHYLVFCIGQPFFIEDAGISFAYARNFVNGEGFATYPGGERVEGYSNALWTFLIAFCYGLGVPEWVSSKVMGAVFGALTLPLAYLLARRALAHLEPAPADERRAPITPGFALLAPLCLALSPQFVIWNASGLENSLYVLLLLASAWRLAVEAEQERAGQQHRPWSAALLVLLVMSRPEGMMYAAAAVAGRLLVAVHNRRARSLLPWLAVLLVPLAAYNAWRWWYFGWPFPNTYYAKAGAGVNVFHPFGWTTGGWKQVNNYFTTHQLVYALPLLPIAMTGLRGWRRWISVVAIAWLSAVVLWDGRSGPLALPDSLSVVTDHWVHLRVWSIVVWAVIVGLVNFGRRGWLVRGLLWCFFAGGIFFHIYTGHEWMKAWRWFNIIGASMFPLMVVGLAELLDGLPLLERRIPLPRRLSRRGLPAWGLPVLALVVAFGAIEAERSWQFTQNPETSVRDIHRRVRYMRWVASRLDLDDITLLDVDMGAHMFHTDWKLLDMAGLVDVPFARHRKYDRPFMREYIFEENRPDFAHVHSSWARATKIPSYTEWKQGYIEVPGYPIGSKKLHVGNHIRKDLLVTVGRRFEHPRVDFQGGLSLLQAEVRSPVVANGDRLYVHLVFQGPRQEDGFQVLAFLVDDQGNRGIAALDPGYGWYPPEDWKRSEQVHGRFRMPVPSHLPPGEYQLGLVLVDEASGRVRALETIDGQQAPAGRPRYLPGEYLLPDVTVTITSRARAVAEASADLQWALDAAGDGECEAAWPQFKDSTRHLLADRSWREEHEPRVREAIAACYVARASQQQDRGARSASLVQARRWDHHVDGLKGLARPLAAEWAREGDGYFAEEDWKQAYDAYAQALRLDPRLSHVRRRAEEARDYKLDIRQPGEPYPPPKDKKKVLPRKG